MGKRFAILIGAAALGVLALGAQTGAAAPDVVLQTGPATYNTKVTITQDRSPPHTLIHGSVYSGDRWCEVGRRVTLFKQQPGTDRKLGTDRSGRVPGRFDWEMRVPQAKVGWQVYARASRAVRRDGLVCRRDRSPIYTVR